MVQPFSNNYPSCIVAEKSTLGVNHKLTLLDNLLEQYFWLFEILPISEDISSIAESLTHRFDSQILVRLEKIIFKTYGLTNDEVNYIYESTNQ